MDKTSWKPKVFKANENVDYKAEEEGTSDGAKKGWLTRQRGGSAEEPKKDFVPIDWAGQVGATKSEADQDKASDLMDKYYELVNEPMEDLPSDGSAMEERRSIHAKGVADFKSYLESSGSATVNQDVTDILEDENYHSLNKMLTKEEPETQSSRDKEFYDESTQNTLDTLNQSKVNGFPFFSYVGQPEKIISDGKGGIILYGMKRNPNSIRRIDVKYDEGRDTYTVSFMSNRNKPKGEYNDVYFDQLGGLIAGNKGLGVESKANENIDTVDDYFDYVNEEPDERKCEFCGAKITSLFSKKYMIDHVNSVHDAGLNPTDGQKLNKTFPSWGESYATEDDYKYDWDQLTSLAQKALTDIGYDKESWDSEPEDIRKEMEKVAYSEENWKDMANKFYNEELNKGKKSGGEAMYGYGSATGRMSPVEAWNQGADVYGDMGYDPSLRNPIFQDFRRLKWNELPTDIQEAWKSELGYMTKGEGLADDIEKQLNRFGVNLDRDPEQVEESNEAYFVEWGYDLDYEFAEIDDIDEAKQKAEAEGGNVYLNDQLVYSVIPSIKKDPTNDKSKFIVSNNLMDVESKASESERDEARIWWDYLPYDERESLARDNGGSFDMSKFDYQSEGSKFDITKIFNERILDKQGISGINTVELTRNSGLFDNDYWTEDSGGVKPKGGSYESKASESSVEDVLYEWKNEYVLPLRDPALIGTSMTEYQVYYDGWKTFAMGKGLTQIEINELWDRANPLMTESKANEEIIPDWNYHADDNDSDEEPYDDSDDMYELMRDQKDDEEEKTKNESKASENYKVFIGNVLYRTVYGLEEAVYIKDETLRIHGMDAEIFDVKNDQFIDVEDTVSHESKASEYGFDNFDSYNYNSEWEDYTGEQKMNMLESAGALASLYDTLGQGVNPDYYNIWELVRNANFTSLESKLSQNIIDDIKRQLDGGKNRMAEGFNQGLYGYVDAKCKTCGVEFDSIPDMDDHYAMHSDHVSNLDDLDNDIPNSD